MMVVICELNCVIICKENKRFPIPAYLILSLVLTFQTSPPLVRLKQEHQEQVQQGKEQEHQQRRH